MTKPRKRLVWAMLILSAALAYGQSDQSAGIPRTPYDTSGAVPDTADTNRAVMREVMPQEELKVVRRTYKYRRQVALAVFMMAFVAVALTTTDALNPE